jgi:pimeloyl-ACP methyl ester carboxylesterase
LRLAASRFHIVEGGSGPPVILMAGFPQSWYAWRRVMPILAQSHTVIAIDLPGQGDSDRPADGYDTRTTGERINALIKVLGYDRCFMAGHDIGSWVAYPYAARYPEQLRRVVLLDANIPGVTLPKSIQLGFESNWRNWHFLFNTIPDLPEALLQGRKRILIQWFFQLRQRTVQAFSAKRTSTSTTECTAFEDMVQNADLAKARIKIPILALGGDVGSAPNIYDAIKPLGEDV